MKLGDVAVTCLRNEVAGPPGRQPIYASVNRILQPKENLVISVGGSKVIGDVEVWPWKSLRLKSKRLEQEDGMIRINSTNGEKEVMLKQGSIIGYMSKNG